MMDFRKLKAEKPTNVHLSREYDAHLPDNVRLHPVSPDVTCIADGIDAVLDNFNATIIQAPTGFGKTGNNNVTMNIQSHGAGQYVLHQIPP